MTRPPCTPHRPGDGSWWARDARGIELARVCDRCERAVLARYRPDVLTDGSYQAEEPIEPDGEDLGPGPYYAGDIGWPFNH